MALDPSATSAVLISIGMHCDETRDELERIIALVAGQFIAGE